MHPRLIAHLPGMLRQSMAQASLQCLFVVGIVGRIQIKQHVDIGERRWLPIAMQQVPDGVADEPGGDPAILQAKIAHSPQHVVLPGRGDGLCNPMRDRFLRQLHRR